LVSAGTDFSEPEIDCSMMAITAAEALQGVHLFTPEMEGSMRGEMINDIKSSIRKIKKRFVGGFGPIPLSERYCCQD
jgi:hypothetical protein